LTLLVQVHGIPPADSHQHVGMINLGTSAARLK
jgi:hypothetical protein